MIAIIEDPDEPSVYPASQRKRFEERV